MGLQYVCFCDTISVTLKAASTSYEVEHIIGQCIVA